MVCFIQLYAFELTVNKHRVENKSISFYISMHVRHCKHNPFIIDYWQYGRLLKCRKIKTIDVKANICHHLCPPKRISISTVSDVLKLRQT